MASRIPTSFLYRSPHKPHGFSLIELMVVLAIMSTLALLAYPSLTLKAQRQKEQGLRLALLEIRQGLDAYKKAADAGSVRASPNGYPEQLKDLVLGMSDLKSPSEKKIYFLRRIPRDPFYQGAAETPPENTWGLRAYDSPPDRPSAGRDVYDVFSLSTETGLNGIPYQAW
ncbi:MAG: type II secretion system protein [Pseudomonadota bacterium]